MRRWLLALALILAPALAFAQPATTSGAGPLTGSVLVLPSFTTTFPTTGLAIGAKNAGNLVSVNADGSGNLQVNCAVGCAGGTFNNNADAIATSATNGQTAAWLYGFNGTTFDRLRVDGSKNLNVNCAVGCSAGALSNAADAVATSSTNSGTNAYNFGFNGTTWDRLRVDASKNLLISVNTALPTGANTVGKIDLLGNAGAIMDFAGQNAASPANSLLTGCQFQTTPTTITAGNSSPRQCDNAGNALVKVNVALPTGANTIGAVTQSGTWAQNLTQVNSVAVLAGSGAVGTGAQRIAVGTDTATIAGSAPGTAGTASTNVLTVQGIASMTKLLVTPDANSAVNVAQLAGTATSTGSGTVNAGTMRVVIATDQTTLTNPIDVNVLPSTSGGLSVLSNIVAANTTSVAVKASAGQLYGLDAYSIAASAPVYVKLYNTAQASVTCGTPTPLLRYVVPASGGTSGGGQIMHDTNGVSFNTAITYCVTGGIADNDTTAPAASSYIVNFYYK